MTVPQDGSESRQTTTERALLQIVERDRAAVATALRAETAQVLATMLVTLSTLEHCADLNEVRAGLHELREAVRDDLQRVQSLATRIQPSLLDDLGLVPALEATARELVGVAGPTIDVVQASKLVELPSSERALVFRIIEEAMRNAVTHAMSQRIAVTLRQTPAGLEFVVEDDGHGFDGTWDAAGVNAASGLARMRAQARALNGRLEVISKPGSGTRILLQLPWGNT